MKVLSLFDGMSCGQIALERAGFNVEKYYASEIDPHAITVTQSNYPNTIQIGDVKKVNGKKFKDLDLLIAGSPCQGFSMMGKQLNFEDPRSKLFFDFVRIKKESNPKYFILENVKMKKAHLQVITDLLEVEPYFINSRLVSAQSRPRYYWTNIPGFEMPEDRNISLTDILLDDFDGKLLLGQNHHNRVVYSSDVAKCFSAIDPVKAICMTARQYANWKGNFIQTDLGLRMLDPIECERLQTVPDGYTSAAIERERGIKC